MDALRYERFLNEWKQSKFHVGRRFIQDGAIDNDRWSITECRVLLLLKEAYDDPKGDGFDLRASLRERGWSGLTGKTWWPAAYWCHLIQSMMTSQRSTIPAMPNWRDDFGALDGALMSSAFMNIKKSDGTSTSNDESLHEIVNNEDEANRIRHQLDLLDPHIVVCGSTWRYVKKLWQSTQLSECVWRNNGRVFIDFWHPAARLREELKYYALGGIMSAFIKGLDSVGDFDKFRLQLGTAAQNRCVKTSATQRLAESAKAPISAGQASRAIALGSDATEEP